MKPLLPVLMLMTLFAVSAAQSKPQASKTTKAPTVSGVLDGPRTTVFETPQDSCVPNDIPDAMARAFRDYTGTVHFITASSDLYQSLGSSLDSLQRSCQPAFQSVNDPNPALFND